MAGRRANGAKFGPQGWVFSVYRILVKLNASGNSRVIRCISDFNNLLSRKRQVLERNIQLNLYVIQFFCGHYLPSCQAERPDPGLLVWNLILMLVLPVDGYHNRDLDVHVHIYRWCTCTGILLPKRTMWKIHFHCEQNYSDYNTNWYKNLGHDKSFAHINVCLKYTVQNRS